MDLDFWLLQFCHAVLHNSASPLHAVWVCLREPDWDKVSSYNLIYGQHFIWRCSTGYLKTKQAQHCSLAYQQGQSLKLRTNTHHNQVRTRNSSEELIPDSKIIFNDRTGSNWKLNCTILTSVRNNYTTIIRRSAQSYKVSSYIFAGCVTVSSRCFEILYSVFVHQGTNNLTYPDWEIISEVRPYGPASHPGRPPSSLLRNYRLGHKHIFQIWRLKKWITLLTSELFIHFLSAAWSKDWKSK